MAGGSDWLKKQWVKASRALFVEQREKEALKRALLAAERKLAEMQEALSQQCLAADVDARVCPCPRDCHCPKDVMMLRAQDAAEGIPMQLFEAAEGELKRRHSSATESTAVLSRRGSLKIWGEAEEQLREQLHESEVAKRYLIEELKTTKQVVEKLRGQVEAMVPGPGRHEDANAARYQQAMEANAKHQQTTGIDNWQRRCGELHHLMVREKLKRVAAKTAAKELRSRLQYQSKRNERFQVALGAATVPGLNEALRTFSVDLQKQNKREAERAQRLEEKVARLTEELTSLAAGAKESNETWISLNDMLICPLSEKRLIDPVIGVATALSTVGKRSGASWRCIPTPPGTNSR